MVQDLFTGFFLLSPIDQYMAFGISGSNTSTNMVGADVVVTWINDDGVNAIDYYLTERQQVSIAIYKVITGIYKVITGI